MVSRIAGRSVDYTFGSDGATTALFGTVGAATTTVGSIVLDPLRIDARVASLSQNFAEWKLHGVTIEFVQRTSASALAAVGWTDDANLNITATYQRIAALEASRVFNLGSGLKQSFSFRPRSGWLKTSNTGQSTGASLRETCAGQLFGLWDAVPTTANYGSVLLHYDISFRSPCESLVVNIEKDISKAERGEKSQLPADRAARADLIMSVMDDYQSQALLRAQTGAGIARTPAANAASTSVVVPPRRA